MNHQIKSLDIEYRVTFVLTYATLTTTVYAQDEDEADEKARELIKDYYGWQPEMWSDDIEVERIEQ